VKFKNFMISAFALVAFNAISSETTKQKMEEASRDAQRSVHKAGRKVYDKTCELVNGKMECAGKRIKHEAQNLGDKIEDAAD